MRTFLMVLSLCSIRGAAADATAAAAVGSGETARVCSSLGTWRNSPDENVARKKLYPDGSGEKTRLASVKLIERYCAFLRRARVSDVQTDAIARMFHAFRREEDESLKRAWDTHPDRATRRMKLSEDTRAALERARAKLAILDAQQLKLFDQEFATELELLAMSWTLPSPLDEQRVGKTP
jgi:hypothetical protein